MRCVTTRFVFAAALATPLAIAALLLPPATPPASAATPFPWCAHYMMKDGGINCGFVSFEQCLANVSGVGGSCQQNPYYLDQPPRERKLRHARRKPKRS